jgi:hypothetical protein
MMKIVKLRRGEQKLEFSFLKRNLSTCEEQWFHSDHTAVIDIELSEQLDRVSGTGQHVVVEGEKYVVDSYGLG